MPYCKSTRLRSQAEVRTKHDRGWAQMCRWSQQQGAYAYKRGLLPHPHVKTWPEFWTLEERNLPSRSSPAPTRLEVPGVKPTLGSFLCPVEVAQGEGCQRKGLGERRAHQWLAGSSRPHPHKGTSIAPSSPQTHPGKLVQSTQSDSDNIVS